MVTLKKQPRTLNDEELVDIIQDSNNPEVLEKPSEHSAIQFLADFGIYPGNNKILCTTLYKLYKHAYKNHVIAPEFHTLMDGYLTVMYIDTHKYYYVNKEIKFLTEQLSNFLVKKRKDRKLVSIHFRKSIENFFAAYSLKPGTKKITSRALFYLYNKWRGKTNYKINTFNNMLKLYFKLKLVQENYYIVMIDEEFYKHITKETEPGLKLPRNRNGVTKTKEEAEVSKEKKSKKSQ